jgi:hypothetical protein
MNSDEQFSLIDYGRLIGRVEALSAQVTLMSSKLDALTDNVSTGKGVLVGLCLASGTLGATFLEIFHKVF